MTQKLLHRPTPGQLHLRTFSRVAYRWSTPWGELTHRSSKGRVQRYGADETVVAYDQQTRAGMGDRGFVLTWPPHLGTPNDPCKTNAISQSFAYGPEVCRSEPELHSHGWMCPSLTDSRCLPTSTDILIDLLTRALKSSTNDLCHL